MQRRIATAVVGAALIIAGTAYSQWTYFVIFSLISIFTQWEFYRLARMDDKLPLKVWGTLIGQLFFALTFLIEADILPLKYMLLFFPFLASVFIIKLYKKEHIIFKISTKSKKIEDTQKIFKQFYKEDDAKGGFGLGLALVYEICQKYGFAIEVSYKDGYNIFKYILKERHENIFA